MGLQTWELKAMHRTLRLKMKKENAQNFKYYVLDHVLKIEQYQKELYGVKNPDGTGGNVMASMVLFGAVQVMSDEANAERTVLIDSLPDLITDADVPAIKEKTLAFYEKHVMVVDKRRTPEEEAAHVLEIERYRQERQEQEAAERAERNAQQALSDALHPPTVPAEEEGSGPIRVRRNEIKNGVEIIFSGGKPPLAVREGMKRQGFKFSGHNKLWWARFTDSRYEYARTLAMGEPVTTEQE